MQHLKFLSLFSLSLAVILLVLLFQPQQHVTCLSIDDMSTTVVVPTEREGTCNVLVREDVIYSISASDSISTIDHYVPYTISYKVGSVDLITNLAVTVQSSSIGDANATISQFYVSQADPFLAVKAALITTSFQNVISSDAVITLRYTYSVVGMLVTLSASGSLGRFNRVLMPYYHPSLSVPQWSLYFNLPTFDKPVSTVDIFTYLLPGANMTVVSKTSNQVHIQVNDMNANSYYGPYIDFSQRFSKCQAKKKRNLAVALGVGLGVGLVVLAIVVIVVVSVVGTLVFGRGFGDFCTSILELLGVIFFCFTICDSK